MKRRENEGLKSKVEGQLKMKKEVWCNNSESGWTYKTQNCVWYDLEQDNASLRKKIKEQHVVQHVGYMPKRRTHPLDCMALYYLRADCHIYHSWFSFVMLWKQTWSRIFFPESP